MAPRSRRLVDPVVLTAAGSTVFVAPEGRITLVKNIRLVEIAGADTTFSLRLGGEVERSLFPPAAPIGAGKVVTDDTWFVMEPGDELWAVAGADDAVVLWVSGAILGGADAP